MVIDTLQYDARYTQRHINTLQYDARYIQRHINTLQYDARHIQRQIKVTLFISSNKLMGNPLEENFLCRNSCMKYMLLGLNRMSEHSEVTKSIKIFMDIITHLPDNIIYC